MLRVLLVNGMDGLEIVYLEDAVYLHHYSKIIIDENGV